MFREKLTVALSPADGGIEEWYCVRVVIASHAAGVMRSDLVGRDCFGPGIGLAMTLTFG